MSVFAGEVEDILDRLSLLKIDAKSYISNTYGWV
jgi:hypothetical protein